MYPATRRFFLTTLFGALVAPSIPILGTSTSVFIDSTKRFLTESEIIDLELRRIRPMLTTLFDQDDKFFKVILMHPANSQVVSEIVEIPVTLKLRPGGYFE